MRLRFPIGALGAMMSSLATTKTSSFSHVSSTIIGRESHSDSRYFSFHLHGRLLIWFDGVAVWVGFRFAVFSSHAVLVKRNGKRFQVGEYLGSSSDQELLYLPLESFIEHRH